MHQVLQTAENTSATVHWLVTNLWTVIVVVVRNITESCVSFLYDTYFYIATLKGMQIEKSTLAYTVSAFSVVDLSMDLINNQNEWILTSTELRSSIFKQ